MLRLTGLVMVTAATWMPSLIAFLVGGVLSGAGAGLLVKGGIDTVLEASRRPKGGRRPWPPSSSPRTSGFPDRSSGSAWRRNT